MKRSRGNQRAAKVDRQQVPGGRSEGFLAGSVLMPLCFQGMQVKATETCSIHLEKEKEVEADRFAGETLEMKGDPGLLEERKEKKERGKQ